MVVDKIGLRFITLELLHCKGSGVFFIWIYSLFEPIRSEIPYI